jgi:beta-glucosidase/6-phospho-beta-glucosidase/beta-galactosidase
MKIISGIECVRIIGKEKGLTENVDVLQTTEHYTRYKEDFQYALDMGMDMLRIGVPWHRIERNYGEFNWEWLDGYLHYMQEVGIEPILDPLHHVSIPSWLTGGFLDDRFVHTYSRFFRALVTRYPWVKKYTIVNEPTVTTYFATYEGIWYPFHTGSESHNIGINNIYEIIYTLSHFLKDNNKEHWFIDSCEHHYGTCPSSENHAKYKNEVFRFQLLDKLLLQEDPCFISILGLDYYAHSEFEWSEEGRNMTTHPVGYAEIARQYRERYGIPIAMTETNIRGTVTDRQTWFVTAYKECVKAGIDILCWYPLIDSTDWCSLVTQCNRNIDPQGIMWMDKSLKRHHSEFSQNIKKLNLGEIAIEDVKTYEYGDYLKDHLRGFGT